jgi:hypothetical protein
MSQYLRRHLPQFNDILRIFGEPEELTTKPLRSVMNLTPISDRVELVENAIEESKTSTTNPYLAILFYEPEDQSSYLTAEMFVKIKKEQIPASIGRVFMIDVQLSPDFASKYGVAPTPALVVIWKGRPLVIRRPGWEDSTKVIGCMKSEDWLAILQSMAGASISETKRFLLVNTP